MENLETMSNEQLVARVKELEEENNKLKTDMILANYRQRKTDTMEKALKAVGIIIDFYNLNKE